MEDDPNSLKRILQGTPYSAHRDVFHWSNMYLGFENAGATFKKVIRYIFNHMEITYLGLDYYHGSITPLGIIDQSH